MDDHEPDATTERVERDVAARLADHAAIDRLALDLVPALIAKLGASGLGEIEVREGDWKVRLRRPVHPGAGQGRRATDRIGRSGLSRGPIGALVASSAPAAAMPSLTPVGPGRATVASPDDRSGDGGPGHDPYRAAATSPAVGYFQPRPGTVPGSRVRAGDPIGSVDVLGIPQEVVAPADGIVGASLAEPGEAVEYGQELIWIELISSMPTIPHGEPADDRSAGEP